MEGNYKIISNQRVLFVYRKWSATFRFQQCYATQRKRQIFAMHIEEYMFHIYMFNTFKKFRILWEINHPKSYTIRRKDANRLKIQQVKLFFCAPLRPLICHQYQKQRGYKWRRRREGSSETKLNEAKREKESQT